MKNSHKGTSLASAMVSVIIISVCFLSIYKLIDYDNQISYDFTFSNYSNLLKNNSDKIIEKSKSLYSFSTGDIVYIKNDGINISLHTGSTNENYKYINYLGQNIDKVTYKGNYFTRYCKINGLYKGSYLYECYVE